MDDEIIENGYNRLIELIKTQDATITSFSEKVREMDAALLSRMAEKTIPVVMKVGINLLQKGKKGNNDEIYDPVHYPLKMFVLGKSVEPAPYRPDDMNKKVIDQFCLLAEDGKFYELMYSADDLIVDSYLAELTGRQMIDIYGYESVFMLYKAMQQYMEDRNNLLQALEITLNFIRSSDPV